MILAVTRSQPWRQSTPSCAWAWVIVSYSINCCPLLFQTPRSILPLRVFTRGATPYHFPLPTHPRGQRAAFAGSAWAWKRNVWCLRMLRVWLSPPCVCSSPNLFPLILQGWKPPQTHTSSPLSRKISSRLRTSSCSTVQDRLLLSQCRTIEHFSSIGKHPYSWKAATFQRTHCLGRCASPLPVIKRRYGSGWP